MEIQWIKMHAKNERPETIIFINELRKSVCASAKATV
jgi:hypothetical protein